MMKFPTQADRSGKKGRKRWKTKTLALVVLESEPPRHYPSQLWEGPELASMGATWQMLRWWNEARRRRVNVPLALFCSAGADRQGQERQTRATISNSLYAALTCG
jgi:hypothetical protein